jgi:hypothetical protein
MGKRVRVIYLKCWAQKGREAGDKHLGYLCSSRFLTAAQPDNFSSCGSEISLILLFIKVSELLFVKGRLCGLFSSNEGKLLTRNPNSFEKLLF